MIPTIDLSRGARAGARRDWSSSHNPRADAVIETLGDGTRYEPVTAGEYILSRAAAAGV